MFRFLTKTLFVTAIWKHYKHTIITSMVLLIAYFVISAVHDDYVLYAVNANDKKNLSLSYFIKWGALITITVAYFLYNNRLLSKKLLKRTKKPFFGENDVKPFSQGNEKITKEDPFSSIREKPTLKSKGDIALGKT